MITHLRLLLLSLIIAVLASACGSSEVDAPEPTPIPWQRVTFFADRLQPGFAMNIPAEWRYEVSDSGIIIFNYPRLLELESDGAELPSGSIIANLTIMSARDVQAIGARNAASLLDSFIGATSDDLLGPAYESAETIELNGRDSAQFYVSIDGSDSLLLALELSGNYVMAIIVAPSGELQRKSELLGLIFASMELRLSQ